MIQTKDYLINDESIVYVIRNWLQEKDISIHESELFDHMKEIRNIKQCSKSLNRCF